MIEQEAENSAGEAAQQREGGEEDQDQTSKPCKHKPSLEEKPSQVQVRKAESVYQAWVLEASRASFQCEECTKALEKKTVTDAYRCLSGCLQPPPDFNAPIEPKQLKAVLKNVYDDAGGGAEGRKAQQEQCLLRAPAVNQGKRTSWQTHHFNPAPDWLKDRHSGMEAADGSVITQQEAHDLALQEWRALSYEGKQRVLKGLKDDEIEKLKKITLDPTHFGPKEYREPKLGRPVGSKTSASAQNVASSKAAQSALFRKQDYVVQKAHDLDLIGNVQSPEDGSPQPGAFQSATLVLTLSRNPSPRAVGGASAKFSDTLMETRKERALEVRGDSDAFSLADFRAALDQPAAAPAGKENADPEGRYFVACVRGGAAWKEYHESRFDRNPKHRSIQQVSDAADVERANQRSPTRQGAPAAKNTLSEPVDWMSTRTQSSQRLILR